MTLEGVRLREIKPFFKKEKKRAVWDILRSTEAVSEPPTPDLR
jgi:hypothetical protein